MANPLRVGIVGADASGQGWAPLSHLPALKMLPQIELAAVCTAHADTAAAAAAKYGVARAFHDYNAMFAERDIDLVSVVVKVPSHRDVVVAALKAGKNVYCEWPLGANLREAEEMTALAARQGVRAMIGLQARGDPTLRYLRELIADDYLGEVVAVNMSMFTGGVLDRLQVAYSGTATRPKAFPRSRCAASTRWTCFAGAWATSSRCRAR